MTKNVTVFDSEGTIIGKTYPKRAEGLVKNGRARYVDGADSAIILSRSPDIKTSEEDETMSTYSSDELRARIEALVHEAREKLDAVCKTASDAIDELVTKIDDGEDVTVEVNGDGDTILHLDNENGGEDESENADAGQPSEPKERGRFIRISDEDMEKLRARMAGLRESFCHVTEEAKNAAVRAGTEIGKYAETVKAKVSEKLAEREAEAASKASEDAPGTEAYYLRRIEEIGRDDSHFASMENTVKEFVRNASSEDDGMSDTVEALASVAREHEYTNRKLLEFYISRLEALKQNGNQQQ